MYIICFAFFFLPAHMACLVAVYSGDETQNFHQMLLMVLQRGVYFLHWMCLDFAVLPWVKLKFRLKWHVLWMCACSRRRWGMQCNLHHLHALTELVKRFEDVRDCIPCFQLCLVLSLHRFCGGVVETEDTEVPCPVWIPHVDQSCHEGATVDFPRSDFCGSFFFFC